MAIIRRPARCCCVFIFTIVKIYDNIQAMLIPAKTIMDFHELRTKCHINSVNYFAQILGYHFPEHDNDKVRDPIRIGYAYINYASYHPECKLLPQQVDAYKKSHNEHHRTAPHHIEHYNDASEIPKIVLIEMICDWHSANFESIHMQKEPGAPESVIKWFNQSVGKLNWTTAQRALINEYCDKLSRATEYTEIKQIWAPVTDAV